MSGTGQGAEQKLLLSVFWSLKKKYLSIIKMSRGVRDRFDQGEMQGKEVVIEPGEKHLETAQSQRKKLQLQASWLKLESAPYPFWETAKSVV